MQLIAKRLTYAIGAFFFKIGKTAEMEVHPRCIEFRKVMTRREKHREVLLYGLVDYTFRAMYS